VITEIIKSEGHPANAVVPWHPIVPASDPTAATKDDTVLDLGGVFRLLSRRRRWVYGSTAFFLVLAGVLCLVMTPRYKATAQIELLKQEQGTLVAAAQEGQTQAGATQAEDALNFSLSLQTAVSTLKSEALALRVIKELKLDETDDFAYKPLIKTDEAKLNLSLPIDQAPVKRTHVLKEWSSHLKVESEAGTRVIDVTFSHPDPAMAAKIVNQLVSDYIDYRYEARFAAAQRSTDWLNTKMSQVKEQAEESSRQLAAASEAAGIYGSTDSDHSSDHNIVVSRLEQLDAAAAEAQANRAAKEAVYKLAQSGDPELVTGLVGGTTTGQGSNTSGTAPYLLINLRQSEADLNSQYAEAATKYGADNPKLLQIKNKLQAAREEVSAETDRIVGRARQEYMAAVAGEAAANRALTDEKQVAAEMQTKTVAFGIAKNEAESAEALYQHLLETAKETPIMAGVRSTDVDIMNAAIPSGKPASPIVPLYLAAGVFVGSIFGIAGAFVRDSVDTSLRNPEDIEKVTQLPVLGVVPRGKLDSPKGKKKASAERKTKKRILGLQPSGALGDRGSEIPWLCDSHSLVMEAFRSVRSSILLSRPDNPRRVFMMTSAHAGEGKSFSSLHLAAALAKNGGTVLLVDGDMRRGTLSRNLKMAFRNGFSTLIAGASDSESYREIPALPGLTFLCSGATPPNPAELIGSRKMGQLIAEWRQKFDFVVIDCPPILPVTDAALLSRVVDGVLLVVRFAVSKQQAISRAVRIMLAVRAEFFGVIVNDMDTQSSEYGYYGKGYYASDTNVIEAERTMMAAAGEGN
jgi:capsular exopolysaccharide synthesis family protein